MLRITKQTDYGTLLLTHIARGSRGEMFSARDLAAETRIPLPMVSKILKKMVRAELLESHRGVKGGYSLARPAKEVSVADIILALEGPIALTDCSEHADSECGMEGGCPVSNHWQRINNAVVGALEGISLEEMAHRQGCACGTAALAAGLEAT
ncbi:SUF system Fe-S cluster assembly regulator [bacterium]|nr:SUF system Fe-S cluster assembly regulator [bacterium]